MMKIDVYRNLHRTGFFSIKSREPDNYGKVIDHRRFVFVKNAEFVVQEAGQKKARKNQQRNVHAFVRGELAHKEQDTVARLSSNEYNEFVEWLKNLETSVVTYNPFKYDSFVTKHNKEPVYKYGLVFCHGSHVYLTRPGLSYNQRYR